MAQITCDFNATNSTYTLTIKDGATTIVVGNLTALQLKPIADRMYSTTMKPNHTLYPSVQQWIANIQ